MAEITIDTYRQALYDLVRAHNGYQHGMGPCICAAHENARNLLGISRGDEKPAGPPPPQEGSPK